LGLTLVLGWLVLGLVLEGLINRIEPVPLPSVSEAARRLHAASFVADLHADSLLFGRDLLARGRQGHVDEPRLREGGVALQVFSLPTIVPLGVNIERNEAGSLDLLTLAGLARRSPTAWQGPFDRARHRAADLDGYVERSGGALRSIRTRDDLARLVADRRNATPRAPDGPGAAGPEAARPVPIGALLAIEGAHAMESDPANLARLFDAGYRMIGLAHFFDNDYAGSAHGVAKGGLTALGRRTIREMESLGVVVDLAHLSPAAIDDVLAIVTKPVVSSHGGVRGTCDNQRNLSDDQIRRIAATGGVVGIGYWATAVCGTRPEDIALAIAYVVRLVGAEHAALGSDYDGATTVGFDTSALPALTQALLDAGLDGDEVGRVLGGNVLRVLDRTLP